MLGSTRRSRSYSKSRIIIALVFIGFSLFSYLGSKEYNEVTGENQYISLTPRQEIALGLQAAPKMIQKFGGLYPDKAAQDAVNRIGNELVKNSLAAKTEYKFDFYLLKDSENINAFALPGGQIFITAALLGELRSPGQLAGVLGHEIGHVVARHSVRQMAKSNLTNGILQGILVASDPTGSSAQATAYIGKLINMKFGREDELESDKIGIKFMAESGYDPRSMIGVMKILQAASDGRTPTEFFSTHPSPKNRIAKIKEAITKLYPNGVPKGMKR